MNLTFFWSVIVALMMAYMTVNSVRIWRGGAPYSLGKPTATYLASGSYARLSSSFVHSTVMMWDLVLILATGALWRVTSGGASHVVLGVAMGLWWIGLLSILKIGLSVFRTGRPLRFVPPSSRRWAAEGWNA